MQGVQTPSAVTDMQLNNQTPTLCNNPYFADPESWDCACHETMVKATQIKDLGSRAFAAAYRSQLCKNLKVCDSWKAEACCKDNSKELRMELGELNKERKHGLNKDGLEELNCTGLEFNCNHTEIGPIVRLNCPKTCGLCKAHMRSIMNQYTFAAEANMQLDDALAASDKGGGGWTLTPTMPQMTHTPTADQSCFRDAEGFDCACHAKMQRQCRIESFRKQLQVDSVTKCNHFFVCTHSQTCATYKTKHCTSELKLYKTLQSQNMRVETC